MRCRTADYMFDSNMSLFAYSGAAKRLLVSLKFEGRSRVAQFFAARVAATLMANGWKGAAVPVPPRPGRHEPDAAELVARCLEKLHGVRVLRILQRAGAVQQKSLDYERRKENLRGQISLSPSAAREAVSRHVVLLDDVFTTGATLDACAGALRTAGCEAVNAVTLAIEE
jgi:ComF family protein